ncbi:MAG TPA: L-seryl-tRNA(Sec) selenium transferase, partial [Candidatus Janibacter merdipullorum]|nr:L-seryl-tRNA(Sec) selenium transferase [Candidatus Janibacter merdipullorum]
MTDPRRAIPRTDTLLAAPPFVAAAERLGRDTVRRAVTTAQQQAREGSITPEEVAATALAALPTRASSLTPVL